MKSFIGYRRVSTAGQLDRYGLPAQMADLEAYATTSGHTILRIETDGAKSGCLDIDERPGLLAALKSIESGEADGLLIPGDLDRLARELTVQEAILGQVWKMGGVVYSTLRGEILPDDADDPMRTAIRQVMGVFAQLDRALIAKRMRNGRKAKALTGGYAGYGSPAYGQQAVNRELVDVPSEQQAIRTIQELRGLGMSYQAIATKLNDEGVKPKRGGVWYAMGVRRVLVRVS